MGTDRRSERAPGLDCAWAGLLLTLVPVGLAACSRKPLPGEQEEIPTAVADVPIHVREAAAGFCARLGRDVRSLEWFWDTEDSCWETTLVGLPRQAELDLRKDGAFDELELVYALAEVDAVLPAVGRTIREKCHGESGLVIELSLRRERYLDEVPALEQAWALSGVVLEFQGPGGQDFELDARGLVVTHPVDDRSDPWAGRRAPGSKP